MDRSCSSSKTLEIQSVMFVVLRLRFIAYLFTEIHKYRELEDVLIWCFSKSDINIGGTAVTENQALNFQAIVFEYTPLEAPTTTKPSIGLQSELWFMSDDDRRRSMTTTTTTTTLIGLVSNVQNEQELEAFEATFDGSSLAANHNMSCAALCNDASTTTSVGKPMSTSTTVVDMSVATNNLRLSIVFAFILIRNVLF
jgi:hypothetical protein